MAKAKLTLANGTIVDIEGTTEEVQALLAFYGGADRSTAVPPKTKARARRQKGGARKTQKTESRDESGADINAIVGLVKNCDEAEQIEKQVLDRTSQVNRTLLPLYIVHEHLENTHGLSSGEVSKVTTDLGVPVSQPNASKTLSGTASKYVIGDRVRRKGQPVKYKLSRRGVQYMRSVIRGTSGEDES